MFPYDPRENIEKFWFSNIFRGDQEETLGRNGLKYIYIYIYTFLAPSADKQTHNYDTECSNLHPSLSTLLEQETDNSQQHPQHRQLKIAKK